MAERDFEEPIMPTGSGVADLEIARELDALRSNDAGQVVPPQQAPIIDAAGGPRADAATESEAHPS